jgi:putative hydrolase of the HAD superfamily
VSDLTNYDAILFDVGGTLLHVVPDPHEMALGAVAHLGSASVDDLRVGVRQAVAEWSAAGGHPHEEDLTATWERHYERALTLARFTGDAAQAAAIMEATFLTEGWEVFPDAIPLLDALRDAGVRLGVISNWPPTLERTLERAGLSQYFETIVSSGAVGYAKPRPEIFLAALERLDIAPTRALYVGDSVEHDVLGAASVGMAAVLLDRHSSHPLHRPRIERLPELLGPSR